MSALTTFDPSLLTSIDPGDPPPWPRDGVVDNWVGFLSGSGSFLNGEACSGWGCGVVGPGPAYEAVGGWGAARFFEPSPTRP